jgi:glycosyltransferase involved in cell wall biosynthesis
MRDPAAASAARDAIRSLQLSHHRVLRPPPTTYAIVANGFADGPAQALRDYLLGFGRSVVTIFHPLVPEHGRAHVFTSYAEGQVLERRVVRLPLGPPLSFALDPFIPMLPPRVNAWFGFNPLACARGLIARRLGRARVVALWSVDFVPDRFGRGTLGTRIYDRLDRLSCTRADARIELSEAAREARNRRHDLRDVGRTHIVPMGAWLDRVPTTPEDGVRRRRLVFLGHLVPRQGVETLLEALALLVTRGEQVKADIVGEGPLAAHLRERARGLGLGDAVRFHGFLPDHRDVERILAGSSLAVAAYRPDADTFTRYADPGKLKAYLAAGLPIVLTAVPPNAAELERKAGAEVVDFDPSALADAIADGLASPKQWKRRRRLALEHVRQFDWGRMLPELLTNLGLEGEPSAASR